MSKTKELMRDSERLARVVNECRIRIADMNAILKEFGDKSEMRRERETVLKILAIAEGREDAIRDRQLENCGEHPDPTRATKKPKKGAKQ